MMFPDDPPYSSDDTDPLLDGDPSRAQTRDERAGFVTEMVRKMAVAGMGALFMGEEGIRNLAGQLKLPKELLGYILTSAEKTKGDIGRVVSEEVRRFLQSEKLRDEVVKLLSGMTVEIKAEVRLQPAKKKKATSHAHTDDEDEVSSPGIRVSELSARRARRSTKKE